MTYIASCSVVDSYYEKLISLERQLNQFRSSLKQTWTLPQKEVELIVLLGSLVLSLVVNIEGLLPLALHIAVGEKFCPVVMQTTEESRSADNNMGNWSILMIAIGLFLVGGGHLLRKWASALALRLGSLGARFLLRRSRKAIIRIVKKVVYDKGGHLPSV